MDLRKRACKGQDWINLFLDRGYYEHNNYPTSSVNDEKCLTS
jgi:hypothetical protein